MADVIHQGTEGRCARWRHRLGTGRNRRCLHACEQAGGNRFDVTLNAGNLSRKQHVGVQLHLQRFLQQCRAVDVGVAVNLAIAEKFRIFQAWDEAQHTRLLAKLQVVLKANKVVGIGAQVLLP